MKTKALFSFFITSAAVLTMYSCGGGTTPTAPENKTENKGAVAANTDPALGENVYKATCSACHQNNGEGIANTFPPLAKSDFLSNKENVISQVIHGKSGELVVNGVTYNGTMPPQSISDDEIAAVLTYVYGNWGNPGGTFTSDEIKAIREKTN